MTISNNYQSNNFQSVTRRSTAVWALSIFAVFLSGCGGAASDNAQPSAVFTASTNEGIAPVTVTFDASQSSDAEGPIANFSWDFGDGNQKTGQVVQYIFTEEREYQVTLTVTDADGARDVASQLVNVTAGNWPPTADIAASETRGTVPLTVEFSALNSKDVDGDIATYQWVIDGEYLNGATQNYTFDQPGTYTVELEVTDNEGARDSKSVDIVALPSDATFTVEGQITALAYTDVDGDVNDPLADYFNNDGAGEENFQEIGNPVLLNGYASQTPTFTDGHRFNFSADQRDVYEVRLKQGDYISLRTIDYVFSDLDLYLYPYTTTDHGPIASSTGVDEFESIQAPADGRYLLEVYAHSGFSSYVLNIGANSFVDGPESVGQQGDFEPYEAVVKFHQKSELKSLKSLPNRAQMQLAHGSTKRATLAKFSELNPQTNQQLEMGVEPSPFEQYLGHMNPRALQQVKTIRAIKKMREDADVEFAEPNYRVKSFLTPTDPSYRFQWHYPAINLPAAWDVTTGSSDVVVAVVDSGIYSAHPELQGQIEGGYDFISSMDISVDGDGIDPNPEDPGDSAFIGSSSWHGTHVSATVAGVMGNGDGGVGVAPGVKIMPLRALGRDGGYTYDTLQAVRYAAGLENDSGTIPPRRADIINLSLGGSGYSQSAQNLYSEVHNSGVFLVAAAGNEDTSEAMYPSSYNGVISVAAFDYTGRRAPYSNFGEYIDVAAPGGNMYTDRNGDGYYDGVLSASVNEDDTGKRPGYTFFQGTSMAAPHVSGVIALMKSVYPGLTPDEFDSLLINGKLTVDKGDPGRDNLYGYGNIDALLAVRAAQALADGGNTVALVANPTNVYVESTATERFLTLTKIGSGEASVVSVTENADWLSLDEVDLPDAEWAYRVRVNRDGLTDGYYQAEIVIETSINQVINVPVTMEVGDPHSVGDAGYLYTLLLDPETGGTYAVHEGASVNGVYTYRFEDVPVGEYFIAAGSDVDADGYVCIVGESCGFYPTFGDMSELRVDDDKRDVDFAVGLFTNLDTSNSESRRNGISRATRATQASTE